MYGTAVNLGAGGFDDVMYFEEGGSPMYLDDTLRSTAPGAQSPRPQFGRLRAPVGDTSILQGDGDLRYYDDPDFNPELDLRKSPTGEAFGEDAIQLLEEKGLGSLIMDKLRGNDVTKGVRESGRIGGTSPEFMETLIDEYGYPSVFDEETGERVIPTDLDYSEEVRHARPEGRRDLPTYPELEDARGHLLGSAVMASEYGPETAESAGNFSEFMDRFAPIIMGGGQNKRDVAMDQRNNAIGRQIFMKAGIDATVEELTQQVDAEIFKQLDKIMGRSQEDRMTPSADQPRAPRNFKSPSEGPDVFFPRNEEGYFDTTRGVMGISPRKYRNYGV